MPKSNRSRSKKQANESRPRGKSRSETIRLARQLVQEQFDHGGCPTLRWYRGEFYIWNGHIYSIVPKFDFKCIVRNWLNNNASDASEHLTNEVLSCLAADLRVPHTKQMPCWLDERRHPNPKNLIPFQNGLLNIRDARKKPSLISHSPHLFTTNVLPYDFDPNADCRRWLEFLEEVLGDSDSILLLQKFMGLLLTSDTSYQVFLLLVGPPGAGKGTVVRVMVYVVGAPNCTSPTLSSLGGEFGLWPLIGKLLAIFADAHLSRGADAMAVLERIKSIVGEDAQDVNRKYLPVLSGVHLITRFVITVNELPHFMDSSGALIRRTLPLVFNRSFNGKADTSLGDKLMAEAPGILNWALEGLRKLREDGEFPMPAKSKDLLDNYHRIISPVTAFLEDCCVIESDASVYVDDLYTAYKGYADENGHRPLAKSKFGEKLRATGANILKSRPREQNIRIATYIGIKLNAIGSSYVLAKRAV